ncbi:uncharacterized protein LOC124721700 [Schistocerca piceifrons]|uniref:uncharacterized protein LOC124721700 n=1 Tax=Schistocerca piceifrons TaxID=274613 RepID=UPI001F5E564E|nr:uncharacterized protein LOC124721700 [Schistocerca piceifrons]
MHANSLSRSPLHAAAMRAVFAIACSVLMVTAAAAPDCGQDELLGCLKPINLLKYVTDRRELDEVCRDLMNSLNCVDVYTQQCMTKLQRDHFMHLYSGTVTVTKEICQDGNYKEEYLVHAPCMREVNLRNEDCASDYQEAIRQNVPSAEPRSQQESDAKLQQVCCSFQQYLTCSTTAALSGCGVATANFTKHFLDRMARPLVEGHCEKFAKVCGADAGSASVGPTALLVELSLALVALLHPALALLYRT